MKKHDHLLTEKNYFRMNRLTIMINYLTINYLKIRKILKFGIVKDCLKSYFRNKNEGIC